MEAGMMMMTVFNVLLVVVNLLVCSATFKLAKFMEGTMGRVLETGKEAVVGMQQARKELMKASADLRKLNNLT